MIRFTMCDRRRCMPMPHGYVVDEHNRKLVWQSGDESPYVVTSVCGGLELLSRAVCLGALRRDYDFERTEAELRDSGLPYALTCLDRLQRPDLSLAYTDQRELLQLMAMTAESSAERLEVEAALQALHALN